ncbi:MAG: UDP-N-acetylmuramoyl-L-alanine--D-glutamate ligase [Rhabdochlamydiaceae bacterium]
MKKTLVLGLGLSGQAASALLLKRKEIVLGFDDDLKSKVHNLVHLLNQGIQLISHLDDINFSDIKEIIISPGISLKHPVCLMALQLQIPIVGELSLAFRYLSQKTLGITGTNGKTTVTLFIEHLLSTNGHQAKALGNVGVPLSGYVLEKDENEILVMELSSYQIESLNQPVLDAAVILNISPDHLDRYGHMEAYAQAKCMITHSLKEHSLLYVPQDLLINYSHLLKDERVVPYSLDEEPFISSLSLPEYEKMNLLAAWRLTEWIGITEAQFLESWKSFNKPKHRIEFVREINGIRFYDDSKGTNLDAVCKAVQSFDCPVILIAGGVHKGASYTYWIREEFKKVKKIVLLGSAKEFIYKDLTGFFDMIDANSMEEAVNIAFKEARKGEIVLLSPGCASFDMFKDYAERGERFKEKVNQLKEEIDKL